ncbi:hypothetical protein L228DRAFT_249074 [Xylona heveae TC161]|uniref:Uncharacterized protein n=1 Tax=Xylona heveae (strain CBS 132557 / TC161) TaxID=1328760 RepID=A0A165FR29_XYLHT|nr:hypothetical protein L228DRAFT_249074 [Xylona heveae TC161]KZF21276.1 hypothetical protein L228DRAFT_249074 [Xylona heveae TC161]
MDMTLVLCSLSEAVAFSWHLENGAPWRKGRRQMTPPSTRGSDAFRMHLHRSTPADQSTNSISTIIPCYLHESFLYGILHRNPSKRIQAFILKTYISPCILLVREYTNGVSILVTMTI